MKIVRVIYTANAAFAVQNQSNIKNVMAGLREIGNPGINYHCCLSADGKTFTHLSFFRTEEDHKLLNELPAFKYFQEQLKANGFEIPPTQDFPTLVGSSTAIFKG